VLQKVRQHGAPVGVVARLLASFGLTVVDVTRADAEIAAALWQQGTALSLADRLCLALGARTKFPVATADAAWAAIEGGPEVLLVR
jgi:ribonuclease VapC